MIKTQSDGAAPARRDAPRNPATAVRATALGPRRSIAQPAMGVAVTWASMKPEISHT